MKARGGRCSSRSHERKRFRSSMRRFGGLIASLVAPARSAGCFVQLRRRRAAAAHPHDGDRRRSTIRRRRPICPRSSTTRCATSCSAASACATRPQDRADALVHGVDPVVRRRRPRRLQRQSAAGGHRAAPPADHDRRRDRRSVERQACSTRTRRCATKRTTPSAPKPKGATQAIAKIVQQIVEGVQSNW